MFTHEDNGPYYVKRIDSGPRFTQVAAGFPRRSAGWAWLIKWAGENGYVIFDHYIDNEEDGIDAMLMKDDMLYQYAVEKTKA